MTIRPATIHDIPEIVSIGEALFEGEFAKFDITHSRGYLARHAASFMDSDTGCAFVVEMEGAVVGFILAYVAPSKFSGELMAKKADWVMKHKGHGAGLLRAAEHWAKSKGAMRWYVGLPDPMPREAFERMGFKAIETLYEKVLI